MHRNRIQYSICFILLGFVLIKFCETNQFDPHMYPKEGPYFEGWYIRLTDFHHNVTLGVLFGRVLPISMTAEPTSSPALVSILHRGGQMGTPLKSYNAFLKSSQIHVTLTGGKPVDHNPDDISPADFSWRADGVGYINVAPNKTDFCFTAEKRRLCGKLSKPEPWGQNGEGPEGWLSKLPLPLHWFVYSLRSPVTFYDLTDLSTNRRISGNSGVAHMEKNWGRSFPKAWIWAEGVIKDGISFSLSGGLVTFDKLLTVPAYLIGYRNPAKTIVLNFRPDNSMIHTEHDGCHGYVNLVVFGIIHILEVNMTGPLTSFSDCLYGPEALGFNKACVESYDAITSIVVKKRRAFHIDVVDTQIFRNSALEFGGLYTCRDKCTAV